MIRMKLEAGRPTSVEFDTAEEAIRFLRQFDGLSQVGVKATAAKMVQKGPVVVGPDALAPSVRLLLKELLASPGGVPGHALAKTLGMPPKGLGPVVVALRKFGRRLGLSDHDIMVKIRRRENGGSVRILKLGAKLMKRLRDGEIVLPLE